jgi:hypothetical protein
VVRATPQAPDARVDSEALRDAVWARVQLARNVERPHTLELVSAMADDVIELHGDRAFGDDDGLVGGFATIGEHRVLFGLSSTPTFNLIEKFWGYRYVERTPLDVQGIASRDTGIAASGPIAKNGSISYRVMYGTQLEFGSDSNDAGEWMAAVSWEPNSNWVVELYGDFEDPWREGDGRRTLQGFLGYRTDTTRFGLQYSDQDRGTDPGIQLASLFGVVDFSENWSVLGRVDRLFEPSIRGEDIAYLPFDPDAKARLFILGVEARPFKFFSLIPNIEYIQYDDPSGPEPKPEDDLLVRLTFNLTF